ncbi:hypothetical protein AK812_SmicGene47290, partial [Symbiodinium microadriaticum]
AAATTIQVQIEEEVPQRDLRVSLEAKTVMPGRQGENN